jgi:CheY-like chemotaxis protein
MDKTLQNAGQLKSARILIVDDEPQNIAILVKLLRETGYDVRAARDADHALQTLENVRVKIPEPVELPGPEPTQPDLKITKILASGMHSNKYVDAFRVKIQNTGSNYSGAIDFRIVGLDRLTNSQFTLDRRLTVNGVNLNRGDEKWLELMTREIEWPEEVRNITFAAMEKKI